MTLNNKKNKYFLSAYFLILPIFFLALFFWQSPVARAAVPSVLEWKKFVEAYKGDFSFSLDSDGDGYSDNFEIEKAYSPFSSKKERINEVDSDGDGLSDGLEIILGSDPLNPDTDGDSYSDGLEFDNAYSPISSSSARLSRLIKIRLDKQELDYIIDGYVWKTFSVSTGKASMPTQKGKYQITNKIKKAWSKTYGLWMPYWLDLGRGGIGIHELPVWPNGYREGEDHLGKPVSHGCIRLGLGAAEYIYSRVSVGTPVIIE